MKKIVHHLAGMNQHWKLGLITLVLIFGYNYKGMAGQEGDAVQMKLFTAKSFHASFLIPKNFETNVEKDQIGFKSNDGSAVIRFQPLPKKEYGGKYSDAIEMVDYLSSEMASRMGAKVQPVQQKNISGRVGYQLFMDWEIDGQAVRQCETILSDDRQLITFTFIGTPDSYQIYWPLYRETIYSYRSIGEEASHKGEKSRSQEPYLEITPGGPPRDILLGKEPVSVLFRTSETGKYIVKSENIKQVSAFLLLYNQKGKKITDNLTDEKNLTAGYRVKLTADSVYMVIVAPVSESQHGKTARLAVKLEKEKPETAKAEAKSPPQDIGDMPSARQEEAIATPFKDESTLMVAVELNPTKENVEDLAAVRAAKARDLFEYAEEHKDGAAFDLALMYAESARELAPEQRAYTFLTGLLYAKASHLPMAAQLAEADLLQVIEDDAGHKNAKTLLGDLYYRQGRFEEAIDIFEDLFMTGSAISPQSVTMLTTAYAAAGLTSRGRQFIVDCTSHNGEIPYLNLAGAVLARHEADTSTAMIYLQKIIDDSAVSQPYKLYAEQLKTLWEKEAE